MQYRTMGSGPGSAAAQVTLSVCKRLLPLLIVSILLLTLSEVFRWVPRSSCQPCKPLCRHANALFGGLMVDFPSSCVLLILRVWMVMLHKCHPRIL